MFILRVLLYNASADSSFWILVVLYMYKLKTVLKYTKKTGCFIGSFEIDFL